MEVDFQEQFRNSRPQRLTNEAALFVENRIVLPQQQAPIYAEQLDQFVPLQEALRQQQISTELWESANEQKTKLFALMEQVRLKLNKKNKGQTMSQDLRTCRWEEVMHEVQETSQRWKGTPRYTAKAQRCLEKLGQDSGAFQAWLGVLPAGDYGASICGVFKIAVGAAGQYVAVEDCIFDALSDLPEMMDSARKYISIYKDHPDQLLERKTFDLYLAILKALTHIMQFFADSSIRKFFEPLAKQTTYKSALFKSVEDVKKHTLRIREEAQQCLAARQANMDKKVDDLPEKVAQMVYRLLVSSPRFNYRGSVTEDPEIHSQQQRSITASAPAPAPTLHTFIGGPGAPSAIEGAKKNNKGAKRLLRLLNYDPKIIQADIKTSLQLGDTLDDHTKARASAMVQSPHFRTWLAEDNSSSRSLLVNANVDLETAEALHSPLSVVDAELMVAFQDSSASVFVVGYFCALHTQNIDPSTSSSPTGMVASLVGQLLTQMLARDIEVDLSFLSKSDWKRLENASTGEGDNGKNDEPGDGLDILCILFRELTLLLPPSTLLICVLDEPSLYETTATLAPATDSVMRRLTRLVMRKPMATVFKLLVTCRGRSLEFQRYFDEAHILDLQEDGEVDDAALWRVRHFGAGE